MYKPHRDDRFDNVGDIIFHIEEGQCYKCVFRAGSEPGEIMCDEVALPVILEESVEALDDHGKQGVVCRRYRSEGDYTFPDPLQIGLF